MGLILDPLRGDLFWAIRGKGAYLKGERLRVSSKRTLRGTLLATGFPFRAKGLLPVYLRIFGRLFKKATGVRRAGSAALDLAYVAKGVFSGFFEFGLSPWDMAAGSLLVEEAGGVVSDFQGGSEYLESGNIVASAPYVYEEILEVVREELERQATI